MSIARHDAHTEKADVWTRLREPRTIPSMTQEEAAALTFTARDAMKFARDRLDAVVPGEWDFTLELIATPPALDDVRISGPAVTFKGRLQILGVIREAVGSGNTYIAASRSAFLGCALMFGIPCSGTGSDTDDREPKPDAETHDVPPVPLGDN